MKLIVDNGFVKDISFSYELIYHHSRIMDLGGISQLHGPAHEALAKRIHEAGFPCYMVIVTSERLADEHWDDPDYMHKTKKIICCEASEEARRELLNKYYKQNELEAFFSKYNFPKERYNYKKKEDKERCIKYEIEDALFEYQEKRRVFEILLEAVEYAKYETDEEGYTVYREMEDGEEAVLLTDEEQIKANRERILERLLIPRVVTEHDRVYAMPSPMNHWDYRSRWHQFFFVDMPQHGEVPSSTCYSIGACGSSGRREENGRWAHTFATLRREYGVKIPTKVILYNKHNQMQLLDESDEFQTLRYDLTGNYHADWKKSEALFEGYIHPITSKVYEFD